MCCGLSFALPLFSLRVGIRANLLYHSRWSTWQSLFEFWSTKLHVPCLKFCLAIRRLGSRISCTTFSSTSSVDRNFLHSVMKVSRMGRLVSSSALHSINICSVVSGFYWHSIQVGSTGTWFKAALLLFVM